MVLNLRKSMHKIVMKSFGAKKQFQRKLKEAFEHFINLDVRAAQYLSLYTDALLRKHASKLTEDEVLVKLDDVITIFKYLSDKDIFEDFYKQHLASRLLHTKSHSDHFEKCMIAKLKTECGHQYTSKLEGMFKDIAQSRVIHENWMLFQSNFGNISKLEMDDEIKSDGGIELNAKVLTTGFWPNPKKVRCNLPSQIIEKCELFRDFYCSKHSGKKLMFDPSKGSAELRVMFDAAPKDLVVHTYQMCILLLFNERDTFTWLEIKERLQIEECELERHILAFAHPKVRILLKKPNKKTLADVDTFTFNRKYKNQRVRVIVGVLDKRKTKNKNQIGINGCEVDENGRGLVPQQVLEARKNRVEAAIVRIMKARKKLIHQQLIVEVVHQLKSRFNPNPQFIKQRIASLIEREYLERDSKDRRLYHYLA